MILIINNLLDTVSISSIEAEYQQTGEEIKIVHLSTALRYKWTGLSLVIASLYLDQKTKKLLKKSFKRIKIEFI